MRDLRSRVDGTLTWLRGPVPTSIVLAFLIGALFIAVAGQSPATGYSAMFTGSLGSPLGLASTLQRAIPLIGMALAIAVAFRAGVLNLGGEGQFILGGLAAGVVALSMPGPAPLVTLTAVVAGIAAGALWASLGALLQLWPGVPLLITTLLLSYPARYFASWVVRFPLKDPESSMVATRPISESVQIPLLGAKGSPLGDTLVATFGKDHVLTVLGRSLNWSLLIVIVLVALVVFMNRRTVHGFEAGLNGLNPAFTRYSGVRTNWLMVRTMLMSGGIAGLMGALLTVGAPNIRIIDGALLNTNYAWTGLLVALLALYRPAGVVVAGLFFAAITAGSVAMGRDLSMSPQIASVIQGIVIILIAIRVQIPWRTRRPQASPPADPVAPEATDATVVAASTPSSAQELSADDSTGRI